MPNNLPENLAGATLSAVFEAAASTEPTPGGGCVSALGGYLGIALVLKAIRISARKRPDDVKVYEEAEAMLLDLAKKLPVYAEADSAAFGRYIQAMKLPKDTDEAKAVRGTALREASIGATEVALDIFEIGLSALKCGLQMRDKVVPTILADVNGGNALLASMNSVACENAKSNLSAMASQAKLNDRLHSALERQKELLSQLRANEELILPSS